MEARSLKNCPFCGGEAKIEHVEEENGVAVGCSKCSAYGPMAIHMKADATDHAIYCWNRRAPVEPAQYIGVIDWAKPAMPEAVRAVIECIPQIKAWRGNNHLDSCGCALCDTIQKIAALEAAYKE